MEKSSKRGKIPQQDWPSIIARHEAGETLASIARTYDCSPPAISYIVSRSRARKPADEPAPAVAGAPPEPQLVKTNPTPPAAAEPPPVAAAPPVAPPPAAPAAPRNGNGSGERSWTVPPERSSESGHAAIARPAPPPGGNGDAKRTLHLSLGNGGSRPAAAAPQHQAASGGERLAPRPAPDRFERQPGERREPTFAAEPSSPSAPDDTPPAAPRNGNAVALDRALRERVDNDIAAFLAAFDAALASDTVENRTGLREATDRLLRAGARTRIELERLEARVPLTPRERGHAAPAWRPR